MWGGPYVEDRSGEIIGNAIANAFAQYAQRRDSRRLEKKQDDRQAQGDAYANVLREIQLRDQGVVPNAEANPGAMLSGSGRMRGPVQSPPPIEPAPDPKGGPSLQMMGMAPAPGAFDPQAGTFAPVVPRFQPLGKTGYSRDLTQTPEAKRLAQVMAEREQALADEERHRAQGNEDYRLRKGIDAEFAKPDTDTWETRETSKGLVQVNTRTGQTRPLGLMGYHPPRENLPGLTPAQANSVKSQQMALLNLQRALGALKAHVQKNGVAYLPGTQERASLAPLVSDARIMFKEAANLGAITGPDMEIINDMIGNPASIGQVMRGGKDGALKSFDQMEQSLRRRAQSLTDVYGVQMPGSFNTGSTLEPLTPAQTTRASQDPEYREFLKSKGYTLP